MRNYITPAQFDLPNAAIEVRQAHARQIGRRPLELIHDDRHHTRDTRSNLLSQAISPVSDFEGFGSFSG